MASVSRIRLDTHNPRNCYVRLAPAISTRFTKENPIADRAARGFQIVALAGKVISAGDVVVVGRSWFRVEDRFHLPLDVSGCYSAARGDACFSLVQRVRMSRDFALPGVISAS